MESLKTKAASLFQRGKWKEAGALFSELRRRDPDDLDAYNFLGLIGLQLDDLPAAKEVLEAGLKRDQANPQLWNNLGLVLIKMHQWALAEQCMRAALRGAPDQLPSRFNLARTLLQQTRFTEALEVLAGLERTHRADAEYHFMVGTCHLRLEQLDRAEAALLRTLELNGDLIEARNNYGVLLRSQGRIDEAAAVFDEALRRKPDHPETHINRATVRLLQGDFAGGWEEFDWRFASYRLLLGMEDLTMERWGGEPLPGKTILLLAEQGLGDTLQFIRLAAQVKARAPGGRVILECQATLARLLRGVAGIDQIVIQGHARPPFDTWTTLMSLPRFFCPDLASIPADVPYLGRDLPRRERPPGAPLRVGVVWAGSANHAQDISRSCPPEALAPLAAVTGVEVVSLQKVGGKNPEPGALPFPNAVADCRDFLDTARVVAGLDLVLSVDTAVAHLAGAMGKPLWLLLPCHAEWRWLLGRDDTPWYPTARLFRLERPGDWDGLAPRLTRELERAARTGAGLLPA